MDQSRRDALKKLGLATGVGAAATTEWAKPVVNALVVPAHAQTTSGSSGGSSSTTGGTFVSGQQYTASVDHLGTTYAIAFTPSTGGSDTVTGVALDSISPTASLTTVDAKIGIGPAPTGYTTAYPSPAPTPDLGPYTLRVRLS